jgi:hypothetical protein
MRITFALILLVAASFACYAQDNSEPSELNSVEGQITSVDWVGSVISVNGITISVPATATIYKGEDVIGLDEVNAADPAVVTYYDDPPGQHKAVNITIQYSGDWAV